ncbi:homeobox-leucine zipper protein HAT22-like [Andrographis paniculata]|uniref:homeobox-leucine zipper protein HAT22-like n=1 Tax=Andrographis paniculata TaxID=175694 RepID=UPI0021E8D8F8|nr:homeobox-leucine zipper protein HAT22-like [Andrographis paniculata]
MGFDDLCNTALILGLGGLTNHHHPHYTPTTSTPKFDPPLTLSLDLKLTNNSAAAAADSYCNYNDRRQDSAASSSNVVFVTTVKREREIGGGGGSDDDGSNGRKKLRLSKAQSDLLEESFKRHSTLNPKQKQDLARELQLRPRQVEVWFQNRRARTKLKQTEVDCEFLKKCCEALSEENQRLQKELQELRALKPSPPLYMKLPAAATLTICPSCERIDGGGGGAAAPETRSYLVAAPKPHFYTNQSAAC